MPEEESDDLIWRYAESNWEDDMDDQYRSRQRFPHPDLPWRVVEKVLEDRVVLSCGHELMRHHRHTEIRMIEGEAVGCHDCAQEGRT